MNRTAEAIGARLSLRSPQRDSLENLARVAELIPLYFSGDNYDSTALGRGWKLVQYALKLDPNLYDAHIAAGFISRYQGQIDSARASIDRGEELRPGTMLVKLARAELA